jgi:leucyl aminopeptidase (aminopeptidase T)
MDDQEMDEPPTGMAAAIAAMRAEWQQIGPEILRQEDPELLDDEVTESLARRSALLRGFVKRHRAALEATNTDMEKFSPAAMDKAERAFMEADQKVREMEEQLLQLRANSAEAQQALAEGMLDILVGLEALSPEDWDKMEPMQRKNTYEVLTELREMRVGILEELPVERRRYWESR